MQPDPANIMERTMRARSDYGLKIAKKGFDVRYASDNQLLYNSSFPVLQIVEYIDENTPWEIVDTGSYQSWDSFSGTLVTRWRHNMRRVHGLGYPPMVVPFNGSPIAIAAPDRIEWNSKYIYSTADFVNVTQYNSYMANPVKTGRFVVFAVDIETDVEYPYVDAGIDTEWGQQYDYGIKHMLTADTQTTDPNDLGLNANVQSIMVVAVKVATTDNKSQNVYIPEGIAPSQLAPFAFIKSQDNDRWRAGGVSAQAVGGYRPAIPGVYDYFTLDGQYVGSKCSLVVVRSPMIAPVKAEYSFNM